MPNSQRKNNRDNPCELNKNCLITLLRKNNEIHRK